MDITKEIKAMNMTSNNGNVVPNQIIIEDKKRHEYIFQSYGTTIAKIKKAISYSNGYNEIVINDIILDKDYWDYSRTTLKYLNKFISQYTHHNTNTKEIRKLINNNIIELSDLN